MPEYETYCCRHPESECAKAGGCSGSCNCGAGGDECRPVTLLSGETIPVLGARELSPAGVAAMGELVEAVRRKAAAENPPDPDAAALWARIDTARHAAGLSLREVSGLCGVKFSVLFRTAQGRMPGADDLAAIEAWLAANGG